MYFKQRFISTVLISVLAASSLSGCFTMVNSEGGYSSKSHRESQAILNDTVLALGKPDASASNMLGNANAFALFGKSNTYVLTTGGDALQQIALAFAQNKDLNAERLSIVNENKSLYLDKDTAWGTVQFAYRPMSKDEATQASEEKSLRNLGFKADEAGVFNVFVRVEAAVKPALDLSAVRLPAFQKNRDLVFYEPSSATLVNKPKLGKILLTPLALAADVVTAPLQLIGFGVLLYAFRDGMHFK